MANICTSILVTKESINVMKEALNARLDNFNRMEEAFGVMSTRVNHERELIFKVLKKLKVAEISISAVEELID